MDMYFGTLNLFPRGSFGIELFWASVFAVTWNSAQNSTENISCGMLIHILYFGTLNPMSPNEFLILFYLLYIGVLDSN